MKEFLKNRYFVHICVTPNAVPVDGLLQPWTLPGVAHSLHEAVLTREDVGRWCPMVAHSACDARVAQFSS